MSSHLTAIVALLLLASPAAGQLRAGDSLAVVQVLLRYEAALEAGDTTALRGLIAPGAMVFERGGYARLAGAELEGQIRWEQSIDRTGGRIAVRVFGEAAYAYRPSLIQAKARPDLIRGSEIQLFVLSRLGDTWFIEALHASTGSRDS